MYKWDKTVKDMGRGRCQTCLKKGKNFDAG